MKYRILLLLLLGSLSLSAQKSRRDIVYLKNGSIVRGTIVLNDPGKQIKLKTADNNLWVFQFDQIDSISKPVTRISPRQTGYVNLTELGVLAGSFSNATRAPLSLINISSWQFKSGWSAGVGAGVELSNEAWLPVIADGRYYFRHGWPSPYVGLQAGYSFSLGGSFSETMNAINDRRVSPVIYPGIMPPTATEPLKAKGGILINPAIGIQTPLNENMSLTFSAGYRWMRHNYTRPDDYLLYIDYNRLSLKIGLIFK